ncbi:MAG: M23 family metallopeptidase, partial [Pseudomonadales bacterium]|nr:M23 family metallopeptidase [Pseudomonadales bacterium]
ETIFSIAKKYGLDNTQAQVIVDYPFNEFLNDETFELATGAEIMIPGGVPPKKAAPVSRIATTQAVDIVPGAGSGQFVWPAAGRITQGYSFYHKAIDIANRAAGPILAADAGTVVGAGWLDNSGYGNRVLIDHGNGFVTLYAHLSVVQVSAGQQVSKGAVIGQMGSTGRSTGTHLHFEIRKGGLLNPLSFLQ